MEIDKLRTRSKTYFAQAEADESEAVQFFRTGWVTQGDELLKEARRFRRRAMNILEKKLPKLGEKMAEFMTAQLPGVNNGDQSIPRF